MVETFKAVSNDPKLSHAEALNKSMLAMINNAQDDTALHPRAWAPFVVVGEPSKPK
jgi:CHAT domain-containing protein